MRGVQWDSSGGLHCRDCGGYEIDLLEDGTARCRSCERTSIPTAPRRFAGLARAMFWVFALLVGLVVAEILIAWAYASASGTAFAGTFSVLAFATGFVAIVLAGAGATPGRVALGDMRTDRLGRMYPVHDPVVTGNLSNEPQTRSAGEPGAAGIFLTLGLGIALLAVGLAFTFV